MGLDIVCPRDKRHVKWLIRRDFDLIFDVLNDSGTDLLTPDPHIKRSLQHEHWEADWYPTLDEVVCLTANLTVKFTSNFAEGGRYKTEESRWNVFDHGEGHS